MRPIAWRADGDRLHFERAERSLARLLAYAHRSSSHAAPKHETPPSPPLRVFGQTIAARFDDGGRLATLNFGVLQLLPPSLPPPPPIVAAKNDARGPIAWSSRQRWAPSPVAAVVGGQTPYQCARARAFDERRRSSPSAPTAATANASGGALRRRRRLALIFWATIMLRYKSLRRSAAAAAAAAATRTRRRVSRCRHRCRRRRRRRHRRRCRDHRRQQTQPPP